MKRTRLIYWISTGLIAFIMGISGVGYQLRVAHFVEVNHQLGYPNYFLSLLGTAKLLGVVALLLPALSRVREWAYAGFTFVLVGAIWSHASVNDLAHVPVAVFWLVVLSVSYVTHRKLSDTKPPVVKPTERLQTPRV